MTPELFIAGAASRQALRDALAAHVFGRRAVSTHVERGAAHRLVLAAASAEEFEARRTRVLAALDAASGRAFAMAGGAFYRDLSADGRDRTACLFPGYGVRATTLVADLLAAFPFIEDWLDALGGEAVTPGAPRRRSGRLSQKLTRSLDAVMLSDLATWEVLRTAGVACDAMAGHSYGENAVLLASGLVTDFAALTRILQAIGNPLAPDGTASAGMLAVPDSALPLVAPLLAGDPPRAYVALDNCPRQVVVWAEAAELDRLEQDARARGDVVFRFSELGRPIHTPRFPIGLEALRAHYRDLPLDAPRVPVWSAGTAAPMPAEATAIREVLAQQWVSAVRWRDLVRRLYDEGVRTFVEVGPGDRLSGFVRDTLRGAPVTTIPTNLERQPALPQLLLALGRLFVCGHDLDWATIAASLGPAEGGHTAADPARDLTAQVAAEAAAVLGLSDPAALDRDAGFFDLGLGSMGCLELAERLAARLGVRVPQTLPFDHPTVRRLAEALGGAPKSAPDSRPPDAAGRDDIAIVGLGCRFPGAESPDAFWRLLESGADAVGTAPPGRLDPSLLEGLDDEVRARMPYGGFLGDIRGFDAGFFGISPREAVALDPQQRLLLEVAWEALEHAAIDPRSLAGSRTGVFVGISNADYSSRLSPAERLAVGGYMGTGNTASIAAGRLSFVLGLRGPCLALDTACSSSLAAVHLACRSLRDHDSDVAIAGGVNLLINPETTIYLAAARALSPTGRCRTFDAAADGYVRGEGCGVVILKRLRDAVRDGDRVIAVVRGSAMNHDGRTSGLTVPSGTAQEAVVREALADAATAPSEIGYVEAHGTGTPLGDPIEVAALARVFDGDRPERVRLGSVKTNVGHLEAAAGAASLIKTVLQIERGALVPSLHATALNPRVDWPRTNLDVSTAGAAWRGPRVAGVSAFGMSGTNVHLVVSEPRGAIDRPRGGAREGILAISAQSEAALRRQAAQLAARLDEERDLAAVSRTLTLGRSHFAWRSARYAGTPAEALAWLRAVASGGEPVTARRSSAAPRIAFLCTGQGAQLPGMGRQLYDSEPVFRGALDTCGRALEPLLGGSLLDVMFADADPRLHQTAWTQPALFAFEYAMASLWESWGVRPDLLIGHSVGEIVAACLAGVFSLEHALTLVAARGRLMQSLPEGGGMLAVEIGEAEARRYAGGTLSIAAINAPGSVVLAGAIADLDEAAAALRRDGVRHVRLPVSHAFHSTLVEPILEPFRAAAAAIEYSAPRLPIYSNVSGTRAAAGIAEAGYWVRHLRAPVRFADGIRALVSDGCDIAIELGPGSVLTALGARATHGSGIAWIAGPRPGNTERAATLAAVARVYEHGAAVNWRAVHHGLVSPRAVLPTYPFQRDVYWIEPSGAPAVAAAAITSGPVADAAREPRLADRLRDVPAAERPAMVVEYLQRTVGGILRLPAERPLEPWAPLDRAGLDSLMALQLAGRVAHDLHVTLPPAVIVDSASIDSLGARVLADFESRATATPVGHESDGDGDGPLSYGQRALWFLWMLAPAGAAYNVSMRVDVADGREDTWRRAATRLAERHPALRTRIVLRDGEPVQRVAGADVLTWASSDASGWTAARLHEAIAASHAAPFDLAVSPARMHWFATGPRTAILLVTIHHTACDAWSLAIIRRDLAALVDAIERGTAEDAAPRWSTRDFARWQERMLAGDEGTRLWEFWQRTLAGPRAQLDLPADRPRPAVRTSAGDLVRVRLDRDATERLRALGREHGATMFTTLVAAFLALLYRWTRERDLVIGTPNAGRTRPEFAGTVGYFVDPIVIRADADGEAPFAAWLPRVNRIVRDALAHADFPFGLLVERLGVARDASRSPLFDVSFNFLAGAEAADDLELQSADAKFDLTLTALDGADGLEAAFSYSTALFDRSTIERAAAWFVRLLDDAGRHPARPIDEVPLEASTEPALRGRRAEPSRLEPIHERILAAASQAPASVAVVAGDGHLTYAELAARARGLAGRLIDGGVQVDEPVGLCTGRSTAFVSGFLGILVAGGAYVPLDPSTPEPLRDRMLRQAGARLLVRDDEVITIAADVPREPAAAGTALDRLAYVIFTSGSTGTPKGVAVPHRALANYVSSILEDLSIVPHARHALVSTIAADLGHTVIFAALATGGTLHILDDDTVTDRRRFAEYIERHAIDYLKIVPSHLAALLDERRPVLPRRAVILGGESTPTAWAVRLRQQSACRIFNHYGPTETTVGVMTYELDAAAPPRDATLPLGRTVANTDIWIVDAALRPVPIGVPGEVLVAGACLARGYIGDPERTAERFVDVPGIGRCYRTGDVARRRADGTLSLLGREDGQVKLHGYRIELAHVQRVLLEHPGVAQCAVLPVAKGGHVDSLETFVVRGDAPIDEAALRAWAAGRLPPYMIPARMFIVDRLPLTPNGKLDHAALRALRPVDAVATASGAAPRDLTEERLRRIWIDVLGHDRIHPSDDFFAVGGHSLAAVRIAARVFDELGVRVPLPAFFTHRTLERLAAAVRGAMKTEALTLLRREDEKTGRREPLVLFPGAGGNLLYFQPLVDALESGDAVWGAQAIGLADDETIPRSVEEAARAYTAEIARRIDDPVRLAGHSFGALVAFETARQLRAAGRPVASVTVLDNPAPGLEPDAPLGRNWATHVAVRIERLYGVDLSLASTADRDRDEDWLIDRLRGAGILPPAVSRDYMHRFVALYRANVEAAHLFRPGAPIDVPIAVYRASVRDAALGRDAQDTAGDLGWGRWSTKPVIAIDVPGTHISMLMQPHAQTLAEALDAARGAVGARS